MSCKEAFEFLAQRRESGEAIVDAQIDARSRFVAVPDLAQHAGIGPRVPHPAGHQRIAIGQREVQHFGRKVARPAMLAVGRKSATKRAECDRRSSDIRPAGEQLLRGAGAWLAKPCRPSQAPTRRRTGGDERGRDRRIRPRSIRSPGLCRAAPRTAKPSVSARRHSARYRRSSRRHWPGSRRRPAASGRSDRAPAASARLQLLRPMLPIGPTLFGGLADRMLHSRQRRHGRGLSLRDRIVDRLGAGCGAGDENARPRGAAHAAIGRRLLRYARAFRA